MTIENTLERIAVALETLAGKATAAPAPVEAKKEATAPAAKKEAPKAAAAEAPKKTAAAGEDLLEKLLALTTEAVKKHGKAAEVKALLNEFDVKKASELAPEQYSYYYEKLQKVVSAKPAAVEEDEDDLI